MEKKEKETSGASTKMAAISTQKNSLAHALACAARQQEHACML
jgi:hypothetical protein